MLFGETDAFFYIFFIVAEIFATGLIFAASKFGNRKLYV